MKKKTIVTIGGGTGSFVLLSALKEHDAELKAIVSMADDGGSTGRLRDEYGVLPPGDVRRALIALSDSSDIFRNLFNYRFADGGLKDHSFGNLLLAALEKVTGSFEVGLREAKKMLNVHGDVIPVTLESVRLFARLKDGTVLNGESAIDIPKKLRRSPIQKIWLSPRARLNPRAREALQSADMIVIGPGDLYTSIVPNFLVAGMRAAIRASRAKKVYVANLMTKRDETDNFSAADFVRVIERYLGKGVLHYALFNTAAPSPRVRARYADEGAHFVDAPELSVSPKKPVYIFRDLLEQGEFIRHDPRKKLARVLLSLF